MSGIDRQTSAQQFSDVHSSTNISKNEAGKSFNKCVCVRVNNDGKLQGKMAYNTLHHLYGSLPCYVTILHSAYPWNNRYHNNDNDNDNIVYLTKNNNTHKRYTIFWINKL